MKIVRSILAVVIGLVVSMASITLIHGIGQRLYPLPEGVDPNDMEKLKELIPTMPIGALIMVVLAWESGAFFGGAAGALIAGRGRCWHAGIIGGLVLAATIANLWMLQGHPDWMIVAGLLLPLPVSLLAGKVVSMMFAPATQDSAPTPSMSHP